MNEEPTSKKEDEMYKICPNCCKLIKWEARVCSYCGVPYHKPQFQELRGGMTHPVNSDKNFRTVTPKRPISIVLVVLLGIVFLITILASLGSSPILLMYIIIYLLIFIIITFSLIFVNLRKNKNRTLSFLISTCVLLVILIISSVAFSNIQNKKNIVKATTQDVEKANVTATEEIKDDNVNIDQKEEASQESKISDYNDRLLEFNSLFNQIKDMYDKHFLTVIYPLTQLESNESEEIISNIEQIIAEFVLWHNELLFISPPDFALNIVNYFIDWTVAGIEFFTYSRDSLVNVNYNIVKMDQLKENYTSTLKKAAGEGTRIKLNFNNEAEELGLEIPFPSAELPSEEVTEEEVASSAERGSKENPWPVDTEVNDGEIIWKILSAKNIGNTLKSTNMFYDDKTTPGKFIKVEANIKNIGTDTIDTTFLTFKILDSNFREFSELAEAFAYIEDEDSLEVIEEINPGMERNYTFIFEVPLDAEGFMFEATDLELFMESKTYISLGI